ncbi:unnamed protein product [Didymodactylos carnosus]|uniref:EGF-like domain-containing protein n=1 Tax=Didymodactylos carnosus TaxID=1234261 RepID=A0A814DN25_9BILA|nr:unnamed protein product [Didymodactylos carnosus]CAF3732857.1 unnamed protein product [Didymodactylos carnosus]
MNALRLIIFPTLFNTLNTFYSVYHSNDPSIFNSNFDCLYAHLTDYDDYIDSSNVASYHIIPYCRRLSQDEEQDQLSNISFNNIAKIIPFNELYKLGVTSAQLLNWSAPIKIAEQYEMKDEVSMEVFYNCSLPWFGPKCQYKFAYELPLSFDDIVRLNFISRLKITQPLSYDVITCYPYLTNCYSDLLSPCLDWREICDGKFDCFNGEDEQYCQTLEMSECPDDTYRCHYGGQCIPLAFVRDGPTSADCLDGSDEMELYEEDLYYSKSACFTLPTFRCEEHTSRHLRSYSCGDGQYSLSDISPMTHPCSNGRHFLDRSSTLNPPDMFDSYLDEILFDSTLKSIIHVLNRTLINSTSQYMLVFCESISKECLSEWLFKVHVPYVYAKFHFVYLPDRLFFDALQLMEPDFICFNPRECPAWVVYAVDIGLNNELICCPSGVIYNGSLATGTEVLDRLEKLFLRCTTTGLEQSCSHPSLFHCPLSLKCVSKHRLVDGISDCYFDEDEAFPTCQLNDSQRFTCESEQNKCLSPFALYNRKNECIGKEDEMTDNQRNILKGDIPYGFLCDGKTYSLLSKMNETDETNCEYWPCNNPYVRCNAFQNCFNGADEFNCPKLQCAFNKPQCPKPFSTNLFCPPLMTLMEKYLDCEIFYTEHEITFNSTNNNNTIACFFSDIHCSSVEEVCNYVSVQTAPVYLCDQQDRKFCYLHKQYWSPIIKKHICPFVSKASPIKESDKSFFISSQLGYYPEISTILPDQNNSRTENQTTIKSQIVNIDNWYCNRGILVLFNGTNGKKCFCPPSYFGNQCQWQNQRVSLTLQLGHRVNTYIIAVFQVIIMLVDEQRQIELYHEQFTYVPKLDCSKKYNFYLLYPDQPKNSSTNYSIHIDIFDKITLIYIASWYLFIPFQFLPVNRIATQLFIPSMSTISKLCPLFCGEHGRCVQYINKNLSYFCRCDQEYSGSQCSIKHNCSCSSDSLCRTSSICICPVNKFGSKCYLKHSVCQTSNNPCQNNGLCIPIDDRMALNKFTCLCTENFYGTKCENNKNRVDIGFDDEKISAMQFIFVHVITAFEKADHQRITTLKRIIFGKNTISLFISQPFHIILVELTNQTYYLSVLRERFIESEYIQTKLLSNYQCFSINESMNTNVLNYSSLRRVKYYPLLCEQNKQLMCFYDERYICICDLDRFANCFTLNRNVSYDCQGENVCENGGLCFHDNAKCPSQLICVCQDCYYGTKCQFSTRGLVLSLDYILGYHIQPNVSLYRQPFIIKMSIIITTIMLIFELINGFLSIITFRIKKLKSIGSGLYLLISSWNSVCLIIVLTIKFWLLILSQMSIAPTNVKLPLIFLVLGSL